MKYTPDNITKLEPNEVFVFGSNLSGIHGAGAALTAKLNFGAEQGVGVGPTGRCYALPTKDRDIETMPLEDIFCHIADFLNHAEDHPEQTFLVTQVGCGLAGYEPKQIAPAFFVLGKPDNVILPESFHAFDPRSRCE